MYLVAIMDWQSRKILSWRISNTLDLTFCINALEEVIGCFGPPDIFNTDQGFQFTSNAFTAGHSVSDLPSGSSTTIWQEAILLLTKKPRMRFTLVCFARLPRLPDAYF